MRLDLWLAALVILQTSCREPDAATPGSPLAGLNGRSTTISGAVRQELSAGRYTYFLLQTTDGAERWVVVSGKSQRGAARLTVEGCRPRRDFVSRRLDRRFAVLELCANPRTQPKGTSS